MTADEKVCPRCAETVKQAAAVCRFCGHEFNAPPTKHGASTSKSAGPSSRPKSSNTLLGCLGIIIGLAVIGQCSKDASNTITEGSALDSTNHADPIDYATPKSEPSTDWAASTTQDELRGKPVHYASTTSDNSVDFDFPYNGGSTLTMTVRRHPKWGDDVIFNISKGQFVCGIYDCRGTINYGSRAEAISLSQPGDHSSDTLFATNGSSVISKLKKADRVIVELPFYQEGNQQFTFKTNGLVWPPK